MHNLYLYSIGYVILQTKGITNVNLLIRENADYLSETQLLVQLSLLS